MNGHRLRAFSFLQAGKILAQSLGQPERNIHPVGIVSAYNKALKDALEIIKQTSVPVRNTWEIVDSDLKLEGHGVMVVDTYGDKRYTEFFINFHHDRKGHSKVNMLAWITISTGLCRRLLELFCTDGSLRAMAVSLQSAVFLFKPEVGPNSGEASLLTKYLLRSASIPCLGQTCSEDKVSSCYQHRV
ncbi:hypothetical protein EDD85DRAFT_325085 [Armillaria nabsnona]|nr:hypothetical protein EDD85DRAFT_325085 [Armillaria nabsnona]